MSGSLLRPRVAATALLIGLLPLYCRVGLAAEPPDPVPDSSRARPTAQSSVALTAELPRFQPGQWQFRRTVSKQGSASPQTSTVARCSDPARDVRQKMAELETKGCQFLPPKHDGNQYDTRWSCTAPSGIVRFHDVIIVQSENAYQIVSEAFLNDQVSRTSIDALRVGDCGIADVTPDPARKRPGLPGAPRQDPKP